MKKKTGLFRWDLLPGMLMMILLPLVAKGQKVSVDLGKYSWFPDGGFQYDFFMYWKSIVFLILAAGMLLILVDRLLVRGIRIKNWKLFIPLFIYAGLAVLSTLFSADRTLSLKGMWQQYESVWVLLGYVVAAFYCAQVVENMKDVRIMLWSAAAGAVVPGLIGLTQMAGRDFFYTGVGKALLSAGMDSAAKEAMQYLYSGNGASKVYMASYTPNYAGVYLVLILPAAAALTITAASRAAKIFGSILFVLLCVCLYGSGSRTGLIISGILVVIAGIFAQISRSRAGKSSEDRNSGPEKKNWIYPVICVGLVLVVFAGYDLINDHSIIKGVKESVQKTTYDMEEIQPGKDGVTIKYKDNTLELKPEMTEMGQTLNAVSNGKDQLAAIWDTDSQCFRFRDSVYEKLDFDAYDQDGTDYIMIRQGDITWNFLKEQDSDSYVYLNQYGKEDEIRNAKAVLRGHEQAFSGRGYIWGRTIPLIGRHLLWGSGPDTFAAEFPQMDYVMKANTSLSMYQQLPTRAHSMYLQSALQTGVLSAICLIVFWLRYLITYVKKSRRLSGERSDAVLELGIFLGILGFLLMGIMNDSNLATAPVFWCLMGTGTAINAFHS